MPAVLRVLPRQLDGSMQHVHCQTLAAAAAADAHTAAAAATSVAAVPVAIVAACCIQTGSTSLRRPSRQIRTSDCCNCWDGCRCPLAAQWKVRWVHSGDDAIANVENAKLNDNVSFDTMGSQASPDSHNTTLITTQQSATSNTNSAQPITNTHAQH